MGQRIGFSSAKTKIYDGKHQKKKCDQLQNSLPYLENFSKVAILRFFIATTNPELLQSNKNNPPMEEFSNVTVSFC